MANHKMGRISQELIKALSDRCSQLEAREKASRQVSAFIRVFLLIGPEGGATILIHYNVYQCSNRAIATYSPHSPKPAVKLSFVGR